MANKCAWCRSADTQQLADRYSCFDCGHFTFQDGTKAPDGLVWTSEKAPAEKEPYEEFRAVSKNQSRKRENVEGGGSGDVMTTTKTVGKKRKKA